MTRPAQQARTLLRLAGVLGALWAGVAPAPADGARLLDQARASHIAGDTEEALRLYLEALEDLRREGDEAGASVCLNNASVILHGRGEHARSAELAGEAVALRRTLGDDRRTGRSLTNLGRALRELGRFGEAERALVEALALAAGSGDLRDQVVNQVNLGVLAQMEGRFGDALEASRDGLVLLDGAREAPWAARQELLLLNNRGALYERIGEFRRALEDYRTILQRVGDGPESVTYRINAATVLRNLGDPNLALDELREAESILVEEGDPAGLRANLLSNVGLVLHRNLGRLDEAGEVLERAFLLARESGDRFDTMMIGNMLGRLYLDQGRADAAAEVLRDVLDPEIGGPVMEGAWETHLEMGRVLIAGGDRAGAVRALRTSVALVEGSRRNLVTRMVPRRFLADRIAAYVLLADTLAAGRDDGIRAGLEVAHRAHARLLLPLARDAAGSEGRDDALVRLSLAATRTYGVASPEAVEEWRKAEAAWTSGAAVRLPEAVPAGEAWLVYLFGEARGRLFWMTPRGVGSSTLPTGPETAELVARWQDALLGDDAGELDRGRELYRAVLDAAVAALPADTRVLRIVPDGALWSVPLDALPRAASGGERLLEKFDVSEVPVLFEREPRTTGMNPLPFAFFGPPRDLPWGLPPLPDAALEAEALRRAAGRGGVVFVGAEATEANLGQALEGPIGVLHVASHATVDEFDPGRTGIVLQAGAAATRSDDGFLSLAEIAGRRIDVGLTFLSACSGAAGEHLPGEGVESLGGLLYETGSRTVVASLWDVEDAPTRALVEQFYHQIRRGRSVAEALRRSKLALAGSGGGMAAPRHWAGWIALGDGAATVAFRRPLWPVWLALLAAVLLLLPLRRVVLRGLSGRMSRP